LYQIFEEADAGTAIIQGTDSFGYGELIDEVRKYL